VFGRFFDRKRKDSDPLANYCYRNLLTFRWSSDSEGWIAPLNELGEKAEIYIGPKESADIPQEESCELMIRARNRIIEIHQKALSYLLRESANFIVSSYKHNPTIDSFRPCGIEIFEHELTPEEYSITYDPVFDQGAVWRVRIKNEVPINWGFDD